MPPRRRRRGLELGLILLLNELLQFGMRNIPPVTLGTILGQTLLYMGIINVPWEKEEVCISGNSILKQKDWRRLILSALEHGDDMHLYFNMASFLIKGRSLERRYGSRNFGAILTFLTAVTGIMYVTLAYIMTAVMESEHYMESCAIGFSGVIFALKVLTTHEEPSARAMLLGIEIPGKYAAWVELIVIHMLVPNSSFMGHFAGILAGIIYCKSFIGKVLDIIIQCFTGQPVTHVSYVPSTCSQSIYNTKPSQLNHFQGSNHSYNSAYYSSNIGSRNYGDPVALASYILSSSGENIYTPNVRTSQPNQFQRSNHRYNSAYYSSNIGSRNYEDPGTCHGDELYKNFSPNQYEFEGMHSDWDSQYSYNSDMFESDDDYAANESD